MGTDIDAVEHRTGNPADIGVHLRLRTAAAAGWMTVPAAAARIHCSNQHEAARECDCAACTRNRHKSVFQRLAQDVNGVARKLREFIQKQNAVMRKGDFARMRHSSAARYSSNRYCVVRGTKRTIAYKGVIFVKNTRNRVNFRGFNGFLKCHFGKYGRKPLGKHTFTRTRRTYKNNVMTACGGNFKCLFCGVLPLYITEINVRRNIRRCNVCSRLGSKGINSLNMLYKLFNGAYTVYINPVYNRGFGGVFGGYKDIFDLVIKRCNRYCEYSARRAYSAVKRKLTDKYTVIKLNSDGGEWQECRLCQKECADW